MQESRNKYQAFAAYLCVTDTEMNAALRMYDWEEHPMEEDSQVYYTCNLEKDGQERLLVLAKQGEMGMTSAATLSMKLIYHFRPQYLIMVGIAAGTGKYAVEYQEYGDVVLASTVWNCSNGKYVLAEHSDIRFGNVGFVPRPTTVHTDPAIVPYLEKAIASDLNQTHVHFGYMASGSAVMANKEALGKQIQAYAESTEGLEMEAYGVAYAAKEASGSKPIAIIAKSICDFGDSRKDDDYQKFAAYTSCEFAQLLCDEFLPDRNVVDL